MENKNYYELLEVDKNASREVIEKAYKALVKKYHPDLQEDSNKASAEEKIKKINEAFEVLSDDIKRKEYDTTLVDEHVSKEDYENLFQQNQELKSKLNNIKSNISKNNQNPYTSSTPNNAYSSKTNTIKNDSYIQQEQQNVQTQYNDNINDYQEQINSAIEKAYHDAYIRDLKNRGYKIRYKKTLKDYIRLFFTIIILIFIIYILFKIPFIRNFFTNIYNNNEYFKFIVDTISSLFKNLINSIKK